MATKLKEFDFKARAGRQTQYPWDKWGNGDIWSLTQGEDFTAKPESFRGAAKSAADRAGMKVRTSVVDDKTVVIQFYTEEEKTSA